MLSHSSDDAIHMYLREIESIPPLLAVVELWLTLRIGAAQYVHTLLGEPPATPDGAAEQTDDTDWASGIHWAAIAPDLVAKAYDAFLEAWKELAKVCDRLALPLPDLSRILHDVSGLTQDVERVQYLAQYGNSAEVGDAQERDQDNRKALRASLYAVYRALYVIPPTTLVQLEEDYEQHLALPPRQKFRTQRVDVDDVVQHVETILDDARKAREALIRGNLRLVVDVARRYGQGILALDLVQAGNIGLSRAVDKYDYTKGYPFRVYAAWWIRQAVIRASSHGYRISEFPDSDLGSAIAVRENVEAITLENTHLRVQVSRRSGHVAQVWDKRGRREALSGPGNVLRRPSPRSLTRARRGSLP